jgi:hypothetical protein
MLSNCLPENLSMQTDGAAAADRCCKENKELAIDLHRGEFA